MFYRCYFVTLYRDSFVETFMTVLSEDASPTARIAA